MKVVAPIVFLASGAAAKIFLRQNKLTVDRQEPGSWLTTCADKGGLVTPWYDPAAGESVPVFCVTSTVCEGHLGRSTEEAALPVTIFNRVTKLREEQKSCVEPGETQCCTDKLAEGNVADRGTGNAPCKLGDAASFKDYASWPRVMWQIVVQEMRHANWVMRLPSRTTQVSRRHLSQMRRPSRTIARTRLQQATPRRPSTRKKL